MTLNFDTIQIDGFDLFEASLPLRQPLRTSGGSFARRDVLFVRIDARMDGKPISGLGEAAPLPEFGTESFEQARARLVALREKLASNGPLEASVVEDAIEEPSARFAFESGLLGAVASGRGEPLRDVLGDARAQRVPVNATIGMISVEETAKATERAISQGFDCIKVKVGSSAFEIGRVRTVREVAGPDVRLRLDVNGAWTAVEALERLNQLAEFDIEYVEQPSEPNDLGALGWLKVRSPIRIAADESCYPLARGRRLLQMEIVDVVVLKPMVLGGLRRTAQMASWAREAGIDVVLTSSIESAVGRAAVAHLAAALFEDPPHCGLSTGAWLTEDVREDDPIHDGVYHLEAHPGLGFEPQTDLMRIIE